MFDLFDLLGRSGITKIRQIILWEPQMFVQKFTE